MEWLNFAGKDTFGWVVLHLLIFFARIVDITIGTIRIIYVSKGMRFLSVVCGFFEVLVWLIAMTQIMQNLSNFMMYFGWAAGFAAGNYVEITLESRIAVGHLVIRIITQRDATELIEHLRKGNYGVTSVAGHVMNGTVRLILSVINRRDLNDINGIIKKYNLNAFYSIEDVKAVNEGFMPVHVKRKLVYKRTVGKRK